MATHRVTARVLPVEAGGAVLLLQDHDPAVPDVRRWASLGGGVDEGETLPQAACRELHEETGIVVPVDALLGPVHHHRVAYTYDRTDYTADCTYYAVTLERDVAITFDHLVPDEVGHVFAAGWWTPEALAEHGAYADPGLPDIMRAAITAVEGQR